LNRERDLVGIYLSAHPLDEFSIVLEHVCNTRMADLEDKAALVGREITMGGIVTMCSSRSQQEWKSVWYC
jgi:DNA polymerase-3 subunit alpha